MEGLPLHKQSLHKFLIQERYSAKNTSLEISSQPPSKFWCMIVIVNWVTSFASWNVRILRTNWWEAHHPQDGGWRPGRKADCTCPAPSDVGVQTKGAAPQVNEGAGKHEGFGPGVPPAALFSNPGTQRPSWWSPQACTTFTLRIFCFSICLFVFA